MDIVMLSPSEIANTTDLWCERSLNIALLVLIKDSQYSLTHFNTGPILKYFCVQLLAQ